MASKKQGVKVPKPVKAWALMTRSGRVMSTSVRDAPWESGNGLTNIEVLITPLPKNGAPKRGK